MGSPAVVVSERLVRAGLLLAEPGIVSAAHDATIRIAGARIVEVRSQASPTARSGAAEEGLLAMPPLANAHDHARGLRPSAVGAFNLPFELWASAATGSPAADPYLVASLALGRAALGGAGAVMVHYTRPQGTMNLVAEAAEVCRAAADVGVRIAFAVALKDRNDLALGDNEAVLALLDPLDREMVRSRMARPAPSPAESVALVEAIAGRCASELVDVQFGPVGVQWCSHALLSRIADASGASGRRIHMHLLETRLQREWADAEYPQGIVRYLDRIGLLSPRLSVAHLIWARPDEIALLAERGVSVCINSSSNLHVRSGIAPVRKFVQAGLPFALGIDGLSMDDDDDAFRELRLGHMLHKGVSFDEGVAMSTMVQAAIAGGRRIVTGDPGPATIVPGRPADILLVHYDRLSKDVIAEDVDPLALLLTRATRAHIAGLIIAGRDVVRDGRLTGMDLDAAEADLARQVAGGVDDFRLWQRTARRMRERLTQFYRDGMHTCH